jgi:hypothetical protein
VIDTTPPRLPAETLAQYQDWMTRLTDEGRAFAAILSQESDIQRWLCEAERYLARTRQHVVDYALFEQTIQQAAMRLREARGMED